MALTPNTSVTLLMSQIQAEFGGTNPALLSEYYAGGTYSTGGGRVPAGATGTYGAIASSGTISIQQFYGSSHIVATPLTITIVANVQNFNMINNRFASQHGGAVVLSGTYIAGTLTKVVVNAGVVVGASSNGVYAFDTGSGWGASDTLQLVNNGYIVGAGGNGNGGAGGPAMLAQRAITVYNYNIIGGGGGGGGIGAYVYGQTNYGKGYIKTVYSGGGGGAGGAGANAGGGGGVNGGNSGSVGYSGSRAAGNDNPYPGAVGSLTAGGAVGPVYGLGGISYTLYNNSYWVAGGNGGAGGGLGAAGAAGSGGSWQPGATYGYGTVAGAGAGGPGGNCANGSGNISWAAAGARYGAFG